MNFVRGHPGISISVSRQSTPSTSRTATVKQRGSVTISISTWVRGEPAMGDGHLHPSRYRFGLSRSAAHCCQPRGCSASCVRRDGLPGIIASAATTTSPATPATFALNVERLSKQHVEGDNSDRHCDKAKYGCPYPSDFASSANPPDDGHHHRRNRDCAER